MLEISVIIVSYNSGKTLERCLKSIAQFCGMDKKSFEVIVIENYQGKHDTESIIGDVARQTGMDFRFYQNPTNSGFGSGNNLGVGYSKGHNLFFLNPDTEFIVPTLKKICEAIKSDNYVIGLRLVDTNMGPNNSYSIFPEYFLLYPFMHLVRRYFFFMPNNCKILNRLIWPWGAAFAMSRNTFEKSGKFDPDMFLCNEEPYLMRRIPDRDIVILDLPLIHLEGHDQVLSSERFYNYIESLFYYCKSYNKSFRLIFLHMRLTVGLKHLLNPQNENIKNLKYAIKSFAADHKR